MNPFKGLEGLGKFDPVEDHLKSQKALAELSKSVQDEKDRKERIERNRFIVNAVIGSVTLVVTIITLWLSLKSPKQLPPKDPIQDQSTTTPATLNDSLK